MPKKRVYIVRSSMHHESFNGNVKRRNRLIGSHCMHFQEDLTKHSSKLVKHSSFKGVVIDISPSSCGG